MNVAAITDKPLLTAYAESGKLKKVSRQLLIFRVELLLFN